MKTDLFQSCGHCWVFQICWHIECRTFTASSFRIWNSSTGILLPPLALLIVMIPKAHLTSHSRISGSRWVITPLWLSGSLRSFLYSSSVHFLPPLLNIFCFCYIHTISVFYCAHRCMKCSLDISNFLEEISSLYHSIVFLYFFALITDPSSVVTQLNVFPIIIKLYLKRMNVAICPFYFFFFQKGQNRICAKIHK